MIVQSIVGGVVLAVVGALLGGTLVQMNKRGVSGTKQALAVLGTLLVLVNFLWRVTPDVSPLVMIGSFIVPLGIVLAKNSKIV